MQKLILLFAALLLASTQIFVQGSEQTIRYEQDKVVYLLNRNDYTAEVIDGKAVISRINIPAKIVYESTEYSVTSIGEEAFYNNQSLTFVFIPISVSSVKSKAFAGCSKMIDLIFSGNLCQNNIADDAFEEMGSEYDPVNLIFPESWENEYLPEEAYLLWHGGYFNPNRLFDIDAFRNKYLAAIDAEAAKVTDWTKTETARINGYKQNMGKEFDRNAIVNIQSAALEYISLHKSRKVEMYGDMATPCQDCPAMTISDGITTITLYNPQSVSFIKTQTAE